MAKRVIAHSARSDLRLGDARRKSKSKPILGALSGAERIPKAKLAFFLLADRQRSGDRAVYCAKRLGRGLRNYMSL
jgi:hypothetical protein